MQLRILRAADEIGGNCIELRASGKSVLLDLGLPLSGERPHADLLPEVDGLRGTVNPDLLGVVLSHPHQDHYGLLSVANPSVPVFLGKSAARLLEAAARFAPGANIPQPITTYASRRPFQLGPFRITPLLVDHSAFDAHALLIEADGKRLLYSGDFRLHGRKSHVMEQLLQDPPPNVDALLMEGTTVGRPDGYAESESALEDRMVLAFKQCSGIVLAYASGQNVDRLVTFYRAARRSGRGLILDMYTASILDALGRSKLPGSNAPGARVFLPQAQKRRLVRSGQAAFSNRYRNRRIYPEHISKSPQRWVMLFRDSMSPDLEAIGHLEGGLLAYSMWPGYLKRPGPHSVDRWAIRHGMRFEVLHTSGHASVEDLRRFAHAVAPKRVIPIHTTHGDRYSGLYENVEIAANNQWVTV